MSLEDQQFEKWLRRPTEFIANAWYLFAASGQFIVGDIVAFLIQLLALFGVSLSEGAAIYLASSTSQLLLFALPILLYAANHDGVNQSMRLKAPRPDMLLYAMLLALIGVRLADNLSVWWMLLVEALGGSLHGSDIPVPTTPGELLVSILLIGVLPGVCEELFFRGGLMGAWERRGTKQALVITSVLFALLHGSILGLPTQLLMGFVLGYLVLIGDSLFVGMAYHIVHNSATLLLAFIASGTPADSMDPYANLAGYIQNAGGFGALVVQTGCSLLLYSAVLLLIIHTRKRQGAKLEKVVHGDTSRLDWQELLVLIAGLVTVGCMYLTDLLTICGAI